MIIVWSKKFAGGEYNIERHKRYRNDEPAPDRYFAAFRGDWDEDADLDYYFNLRAQVNAVVKLLNSGVYAGVDAGVMCTEILG